MLPRSGRRLRLGFVSRDFGAQTETYTTLPCFENLDPDRFEAVLFALHEGDNVLETHARDHSAEFHVLPSELDAQVRILRDAALDVVIFGANVTALCNEVARLAQRVECGLDLGLGLLPQPAFPRLISSSRGC